MARVRGSFSRIDWSTLPKGDWVIRRRSRKEIATTASTNQCSVVDVNRAEYSPRKESGGGGKVEWEKGRRRKKNTPPPPSTNQCSVVDVNRAEYSPRKESGGWLKVSPF